MPAKRASSRKQPDPGSKRLKIAYTQQGKNKDVVVEVPDTGEPEEEQIADATHFVQTLADNNQIADGPGPHPPCTTHKIETDPDGTRSLKRRGFSFI